MTGSEDSEASAKPSMTAMEIQVASALRTPKGGGAGSRGPAYQPVPSLYGAGPELEEGGASPGDGGEPVRRASSGSFAGSSSGTSRHNAVVVLVVLWNFGTSILLVNSVKYIYVAFDFRYPLFVAATHMALSWAMCGLVLQRQGFPELMPWAERVRRVLPFALCGAASVGCGNIALKYLYPSFHEMLQAATPLFTLLTSVALRDRHFNAWAYVSMLPLCGGTSLSVAGEANFDRAGVVFSLLAMEFRALRAVLQGWLLCNEKVEPVTLCYYMAPFNVAIFGVWGAALEGAAPLRRLAEGVPGLAPALVLSAGLACSFNLASFLTIRYLNAIGAMVVQNTKTPCTILLSLAIFKNSLTGQQVLGFAVTFFGAWLFGRKGRGEPIAASTQSKLDDTVRQTR